MSIISVRKKYSFLLSWENNILTLRTKDIKMLGKRKNTSWDKMRKPSTPEIQMGTSATWKQHRVVRGAWKSKRQRNLMSIEGRARKQVKPLLRQTPWARWWRTLFQRQWILWKTWRIWWWRCRTCRFGCRIEWGHVWGRAKMLDQRAVCRQSSSLSLSIRRPAKRKKEETVVGLADFIQL